MRYTKRDIEEKCHDDFRAHQRVIVHTHIIYNDDGQAIFLKNDSTIPVQIVGTRATAPAWDGGLCNTLWLVRPLEANPSLPENGSTWIHGIQRSLDGKVTDPLWVIAECQTLPRDYVEYLCMGNYERFAGKIVLVTALQGIVDDNSVDFYQPIPVRARICTGLKKNNIIRWNDDWCDSDWDVELLEPNPEIDAASSLWISGISRNTDGNVDTVNEWIVDTYQLLPRDYVERTCMAKYQEHAGTFLLTKRVFGFLDDNTVDFRPERPVRVRVIEHQRQSDICLWDDVDHNDTHSYDACEPTWDVELAEQPFDPETFYADKADRLWVIAPYMTVKGERGDRGQAAWQVDPDQEPKHHNPTAPNSPTKTICCPHCKNQIEIVISVLEEP